MNETRICPLCGKGYTDYPAISRTKSAQEICPQCGTAQAVTQFKMLTGQTGQTRGIAEWSKQSVSRMEWLIGCFNRHLRFDWGDMDEEDLRTNDIATVSEDRIFSSYNIPEEMQDGESKVWIVTEWTKDTTTIMFPSEY